MINTGTWPLKSAFPSGTRFDSCSPSKVFSISASGTPTEHGRVFRIRRHRSPRIRSAVVSLFARNTHHTCTKRIVFARFYLDRVRLRLGLNTDT